MVNLPSRLLKGNRGASSEDGSAQNHIQSPEGGDEQNDILARLQISAQTVIPESVMSSREAKAVRFTRSTPGYYYPDVEQAVEEMSKTIAWFEESAHKRDLDIHRIAREVDQLETALQNKQFQVESLSVTSSSILVDENQQPLPADSLQAQLAIALEEKRSAQTQIAEMHATIQSLQELNEQARVYTEYQDEQIRNLEGQLTNGAAPLAPAAKTNEDVSVEVEALRAELARKQAELETVSASTQSLEAQVTSLLAAGNTSNDVDTTQLVQDYAALQAWADQVTPQYEEAVNRVSSLETQVATLQNEVAELTSKLDQATQYADSLENFAKETEAYIDTLLSATDAAVTSQVEAAEAAQQLLHTTSPQQAKDTASSIDMSQSKQVSSPYDAPQVAHVAAPQVEEDAFSHMLSDLMQPEVSPEELSRLKQARPTINYAHATPGAPLTSLRPGETLDDIS